MSITPRGMSIQEAYELYRSGKLLVNRKYQRKLVWTIEEKENLIDSILQRYPIPLFLLAKRLTKDGRESYEIMDGMQRFSAIFSFIENFYPYKSSFFDTTQFATAKLYADEGAFQPNTDKNNLLPPRDCASLLNYQLAVTIYSFSSESEVTEVFGRINSGGKQLSPQEKRQAGVITPFAETVRKIASGLRGDDTKEILLLIEMPVISIDSKAERQGYGIRAEDTLWVKQGILSVRQFRDSEDEQMIADISASILFNEPLASSELLDKIYDSNSDEFVKLENALSVYSAERLVNEIKGTFSTLREVIESYSNTPNCLRQTVQQGVGGSGIKTAFYAIFMAFFDLIVRRECSPADPKGIMESLTGIGQDLKPSAKYTTTADRIKNISKVKGLIQEFFVKKEPSILYHGPGLALDFENSLLRSRIESSRYEFKQGLLALDQKRMFSKNLIEKIVQTICAIANLGPNSEGYIYIGVADNEKDAQRIKALDDVDPIEISGRYVVGIEREANFLGITLEQHIERLVGQLRSSELSLPLKSQLLSNIDPIPYRGKHVVRLKIPSQRDVSFVGKKAFVRENSSTVEVDGPGYVALTKLFS